MAERVYKSEWMRERIEAWKAAGKPTENWQQFDAKASAHSPHVRRPAETEPKRPELKGPKPPVSAAIARQIKSEFALALWGADQGAARLWPTYWQTPEDRLQDDERTALVNATYAELAARFPQVLVWLGKASESATEAMLVYTIAMVAAPRLARHGVIPQELASAIVFAPIVLAAQRATEQQSATVEAERAPERDRSDGYGEVDLSGVPPELSQIQGGPEVQARSGDVSDRSDSQDRRGNGRHAL